jgi:hypothetical protein
MADDRGRRRCDGASPCQQSQAERIGFCGAACADACWAEGLGGDEDVEENIGDNGGQR